MDLGRLRRHEQLRFLGVEHRPPARQAPHLPIQLAPSAQVGGVRATRAAAAAAGVIGTPHTLVEHVALLPARGTPRRAHSTSTTVFFGALVCAQRAFEASGLEILRRHASMRASLILTHDTHDQP